MATLAFVSIAFHVQSTSVVAYVIGSLYTFGVLLLVYRALQCPASRGRDGAIYVSIALLLLQFLFISSLSYTRQVHFVRNVFTGACAEKESQHVRWYDREDSKCLSSGSGALRGITMNEEEKKAGGEIYRNEAYGFELQYPEGWFVTETSNEILFEENSRVLFVIRTEEISEKSSGEWYAKRFSDRGYTVLPAAQAVTIGGIEGVRFVDPISEGGCDEIFAVVKSGRLFKFSRASGTCDYPDDLFENMVASFKFLN